MRRKPRIMELPQSVAFHFLHLFIFACEIENIQLQSVYIKLDLENLMLCNIFGVTLMISTYSCNSCDVS